MIKKMILISAIIVASFVFWLGIQKSEPKQNSGSFSKTDEVKIDLKTYDLENLYREIKNRCNEISCFEKELQSAIPTYGPAASLELLQKLQADKSIDLAIDDHQIAHRIGRETAKVFGPNGKSFLLCPTSYNYGCQHGFFEYVLGKTSSTKEAAAVICGSIENDASYSSKFKFYCYHGLGHGVLMAQAYDLPLSLVTCDSLPTNIGQAGCWQGVFMENVNGGMRGEARSNVFSKTDPLAPCNSLDEKYHRECYINHAGWLMNFFHNDVAQASRACLKASTQDVSSCLQSIGLMTTNPSWQRALLPNPTSKKPESIPKEICDQFPQSHRQYCIIGAVDNIMNFNESDISKAAEFCSLVDKTYTIMCYQKIGTDLRNQTVDTKIIMEQCSTLEDSLKNVCIKGAGLNDR